MLEFGAASVERLNNYELDEVSSVDPYAPQSIAPSFSESSDLEDEAAKNRIKKLAQRIYDTTPGINQGKYPSHQQYNVTVALTQESFKLHRVSKEEVEHFRQHER